MTGIFVLTMRRLFDQLKFKSSGEEEKMEK